jgi:hypothetical protein
MDLLEQKKISADQFKRHPWELTRLKILLFLLKKNSTRKFIVDIGSGDAFIITELAKKFPTSTLAAVDINYDGPFLKKNTKNNVQFFKSMGDIPRELPVDKILLMDVLEHVPYPEKILQDIKALPNVSISTKVFITVPAFQSLFSEHDIFLNHFKRYNRKQLALLLKREGFKIKQSGYFFFSLLLPRLFQNLFGNKPATGVHNWKQGTFLTSIMLAILWIDFKICWYLSRIGIYLPGLTCYCICHPLPS